MGPVWLYAQSWFRRREPQVLVSARTSQITTSPCGGPSKPLNMFIIITDHTTSSCQTRFIRSSDSSTGWIRLQQLSMAKHIRYNGSSDAHKLKPSFAGSSGSGYLGYKDGICTHRMSTTADKTYLKRMQYVRTRSKSISKPYMNQVRACLCT